MTSKTSLPQKVFSVQDANRTLPLVRAIASDLVYLSREVMERRERLRHLTAGRDLDSDDLYGEELSQMEEELAKDTGQLREYADELRQLGVEPRNASLGLVDFPSQMDGKPVYLCWKYNEPEVLYWHETDAGIEGRQPLTTSSLADGEDTDSENSAS